MDSQSSDISHSKTSQPGVEDLARIVKTYVNELPFWDDSEISIPRRDREFEMSILRELEVAAATKKWKVKSGHLRDVGSLAAGVANFFYPLSTPIEKRVCALYTWILTYIDDVAPSNPEPYMEFQRRFHAGLPQLDPVLDDLVGILHSFYDLWDTPFANFMVTATCESMTVTCVENDIKAFTPAHPDSRFPWFLRARTGISIVYAMMMFPKSRPIDFQAFFRALPDLEFWIAALNDLMSFYKEYVNGEEGTYIYHRAHMQGISQIQALSDMKEDLASSSKIVTDVFTRFGDSTVVETWKHMAFGYVLWHLEYPRYRLKDIGLSPVSSGADQ